MILAEYPEDIGASSTMIPPCWRTIVEFQGPGMMTIPGAGSCGGREPNGRSSAVNLGWAAKALRLAVEMAKVSVGKLELNSILVMAAVRSGSPLRKTSICRG